MAGRKKLDLKCPLEGRDKDKVYHITEMPSEAGEKWAFRALLALQNAGVQIPPELLGSGMAGIAYSSAQQFIGLQYREFEDLMDQMMTCVTFKPSSNVERELIPDDIEEILTRVWLKTEILTLHTGFSIPGMPWNATSEQSGSTSKNTPMFRRPWARSSEPNSQH